MNPFSKVKIEIDPTSVAHEEYSIAQEHYDEGDYQAALSVLSSGLKKAVDYLPLYPLAVKCLRKLNAYKEARFFRHALLAPDKYDSYYDLGQHFFDVENYDLALPFLQKAVSLDAIEGKGLHTLAVLYARRFQIEKASELLKGASLKENYWNYWYWCKLQIFQGKTKGLRKRFAEMKRLHRSPSDLVGYGYDWLFDDGCVKGLEEMLARYESLGKPQLHIRDWHFIQYGGIILNYFEEPEEFVAGGRYVAAWGEMALLKKIITQLKSYLYALNVNIEQVVYMEGRNSKIIGKAIGQELDLASKQFVRDEIYVDTLFVAADSREFTSIQFPLIEDGQILFALNHNWLNVHPYTPDIIGLMSQSFRFPWEGEGFRIHTGEDENIETTDTPVDYRSTEEIIRDLSNKKGEREEGEHLSFYLSHKTYLKAIGRRAGEGRVMFTVESPVPGAYFG